MARKAKISASKQARFKKARPIDRSYGSRAVRKKYLIVCEGEKTEPNDFGCAWSNEAFELWYILHFEYRNTGMTRDKYKAKLTGLLGSEYKKNDSDMYSKLADKQKDAIQNASKLLETHVSLPPSSSNPATTVFKLVQELLELREVR